MFQIPKVFSSPYLAGPTLTDGPAGCTIFTPAAERCGDCHLGYHAQAQVGRSFGDAAALQQQCIDSVFIPPTPSPTPTSTPCQEGFTVGVTFGGAVVGAIAGAIAADSFPGPVVPG